VSREVKQLYENPPLAPCNSSVAPGCHRSYILRCAKRYFTSSGFGYCGSTGAETADQRLANLKQEVSLTPAQEKKVKPIIEKYVADISANRSDTKATKEERDAKRNALRKQYNDQINAVLTPEQQAKWRTSKKAIFERRPSPTPTGTPKKP